MSTLNHGFICNSDGQIIYPLYFERIGVTLADKGVAFILGIRKIAFKVSQDLSENSEAIPCEQSHDGFIDQFNLQKLYVVNGKNINERAKKKGKPQVVQDETDGNEEEKNAAVEQEPTTIAAKEAQVEPEDVVSEPLPEAVPDIPPTPSKPAFCM